MCARVTKENNYEIRRENEPVWEKVFLQTCVEIKRQKLEAGESVVDLSIGAPNIPAGRAHSDVLCKEAADKNNYIYAINDQKDLLQAVSPVV